MNNTFTIFEGSNTKDLDPIDTQFTSYYDNLITSPFSVHNNPTFSQMAIAPPDNVQTNQITKYNPITIETLKSSRKVLARQQEEQTTSNNPLDFSTITATTGNNKQSYRENRDIINNFLRTELGLSAEQSAGVLGVLYSESRLDPSIVRKGGTDTGLAQWVGPRKAKFKELFGKELKDSTIYEQLEFIKYELNHTHQILDKLRQSETPEKAAEIWFAGYENGGGGGTLVSRERIQKAYQKHYPDKSDIYTWMMTDRAKNARKIYNELLG